MTRTLVRWLARAWAVVMLVSAPPVAGEPQLPTVQLRAAPAIHMPHDVVGLEAQGTDKIAGKKARFFMSKTSEWEIEFALPHESRE